MKHRHLVTAAGTSVPFWGEGDGNMFDGPFVFISYALMETNMWHSCDNTINSAELRSAEFFSVALLTSS